MTCDCRCQHNIDWLRDNAGDGLIARQEAERRVDIIKNQHQQAAHEGELQ